MIEDDKMYYLRENAYFEPLINNWYVWPYLIPPVQSALFSSKKQLKIMKSFVKNPKLHEAAAKHSSLAGGEFLTMTSDHKELVKKLIDKVETEHQIGSQVAKAIDELEVMLNQHTSGMSLEHIYKQIPDVLKGYVELYMDNKSNTGYRLIEGLLYESPLYNTSSQSLCFGLINENNERPFVFSTPRVPEHNNLILKCSFTDSATEKLLASRTCPISGQELLSIFESNHAQGALQLDELFTDTPVAINHTPIDKGVKLTYLGHAGFLVESPHCSVLVDPIVASKNENDSFVSFTHLPQVIDYICLTHTHSDHTCIETLLQLRHKTRQVLVPKNNGGTLTDPSLKLMLNKIGFIVGEFENMERLNIPGGHITAIPFLGEHGDLDIRSKTAWYIELEEKTMYFGADSKNVEPHMYERIKHTLSEPDIVAIGMECVGAPFTWIYGPLIANDPSKEIKDSRRLNGCTSSEAMQLISTLEPKSVLIYALGMEPWFSYFMGISYSDDSEQLIESQKLIKCCHNNNIHCEKISGNYELKLT